MISKKGIYYSIDAILAGIFLISAIYLMVQTPIHEVSYQQKSYFSQDLLNSLSELKLSEVNSAEIQWAIANGTLEGNKSVMEQAGEYWAINDPVAARNLINSSFNASLLNGKSINISMNGDQIFFQGSSSENSDSGVSKRMIAGISKGFPITGTSASAYLEKIHDKKTSSYSYFGGFIGQGNISVKMSLPTDFNSSRLIDAVIKIETPGSFKLYINGIQCQNTYTGNTNQVSLWTIAPCNSSFNPGMNTFELQYTSALNTSYVSGGFIKLTYTTDTLMENSTQGYYRYYFPNIHGFINVYDTVSVQGNINNWTLNTTFYNPYQTFFNFGNETIFLTQGNSTSNQTIIYSKYNQMLPQEPIPIRFAITNFSNITTAVYGNPADTFIVTDTSGSMDECIGTALNCSYLYRKTFSGTYIPISCIVYSASSCNNNPDNPCGGAPFNRGKSYDTRCNQSKLDVAKSVDNTFVDTIFTASSLHSIGLVDFDTTANSLTALTNNAATLHSTINGYNTGGSTCTCCGINRARNNLTSSNNTKFMIVLSDGDANICCTSLNDTTGTGNSTSCAGGALTPLNWSIFAGQTACANNITVFTIGFGSGMSASGRTAMQQTACNTSLYFTANDTGELQDVFNNITQQILVAANFSSQTVNVIGNFTPSTLYGSSYIDLYFTPYYSESYQGRISLNFESDLSNNSCNSSIYIPENVMVWDAFVTSFSDKYWTKQLRINNNVAFDLNKYGSSYITLGDPFQIQVPSTYLVAGAYNNISLDIGDSPSNYSNCSGNNSLIYSAFINSSTRRTDSLEFADGCNWTIESRNGAMNIVRIPETYSGNNTCKYTKTNISYNEYDAYDSAMYDLLTQLDPEGTGSIIVDLQASDLEITLTTIGSIPYLWGPSIATVEVKS
jgi:hypothetical protein